MKKFILFSFLCLFSCNLFAAPRHVTVINHSNSPLTVTWTAWGCIKVHQFGKNEWPLACKEKTLNPTQASTYKFKWGTHQRMIFIDHQVGHYAYVCKQICHPHSKIILDDNLLKYMHDSCKTNKCDL